jgi:tRNA(fMet)-specific endonuclease VapC
VAVFDTSFLIDIMRNKREAVSVLEELEEKEAALYAPSPAIMELWGGALRSNLPEQEKKKVDALLGALSILPFDAKAAKEAAEIEVTLQRRGAAIQTADVMTAGIALSRGETVVTADSDYARIPGLKVLKY